MLTLLVTVARIDPMPLVEPALFTESVLSDADDPAVIYRGDKSLIIGTDKASVPDGGVYVFDLNGKIVARMQGMNRPNNVDVVQNFGYGRETGALAVVTERLSNRLRMVRVGTTSVTDVTGVSAVPTTGGFSEPMGVTVTQSGANPAVFLTPNIGPRELHNQWGTLRWNHKTLLVDYVFRAAFGGFSAVDETEAMVCTEDGSEVYYSDEKYGIHAYSFKGGSMKLRGIIKNDAHSGDHEGLALWGNWLVSTDQRAERSVFWLYDRKSLKLVGSFSAPVDDTDGIEIFAKPMGPKFPKGIMVAMNSKDRNFAIFDLRAIASALQMKP